MTKIISIIVSIVMLVMTSIFPGFVWPGTKTVETAYMPYGTQPQTDF